MDVFWVFRQILGDSEAVQHQLQDVQHICASEGAFAALLSGGRVVTWGHAGTGGESSFVQEQLHDVLQISALVCLSFFGGEAVTLMILMFVLIFVFGFPYKLKLTKPKKLS